MNCRIALDRQSLQQPAGRVGVGAWRRRRSPFSSFLLVPLGDSFDGVVVAPIQFHRPLAELSIAAPRVGGIGLAIAAGDAVELAQHELDARPSRSKLFSKRGNLRNRSRWFPLVGMAQLIGANLDPSLKHTHEFDERAVL